LLATNDEALMLQICRSELRRELIHAHQIQTGMQEST